jgi:diguanylate cyclase (GGDEF)-like protein
MRSPYADQLSAGFPKLRFAPALEKEFREFYIKQTVPRGRISSLVALILVIAVTIFELVFGGIQADNAINVVRLGLLCPLLTMLVAGIYLPALERFYSQVASFGVAAVGLLVTYMCVASASAGASYVLAGTLLVNLYACLFLGLLFYRAAVISVFLAGSYLVMGIAMQLMSQELFYSAAMLGTAAVIGMIATYNLEHAIRKSFLERNLLFELAERDGLTGLYNRRIFDNFMRRLWRQSRREETAIEIILIDIDYFKVYNDLYGHQVGDDTLKKVAQSISKRAKRPFDFCARYGGEEFVLVLYGPPADYAKSVPEQIRQDVLDMAIAHEGSGVGVTVTVSVGVAIARPGSGRSLTGAIQAADEALYLAKKQGRNRVVSMDASISEVETGKFRTAFKELA